MRSRDRRQLHERSNRRRLDRHKNPRSLQVERIDYVFLLPLRRCQISAPTGVFRAQGEARSPRTGSSSRRTTNGVEATVRCRTTAADLLDANSVVSTSTTTTAPGLAVTPAIKDSVTAAFTTLFAPNPDPDAQLSALEHAAALRDSFVARKQTGRRARGPDLGPHRFVRPCDRHHRRRDVLDPARRQRRARRAARAGHAGRRSLARDREDLLPKSPPSASTPSEGISS